MAQANLLLTHPRHAHASCLSLTHPLGTVTEVIKHFFVAVSQLVDQLCRTHEMGIDLFAKPHVFGLELAHRRLVTTPGTQQPYDQPPGNESGNNPNDDQNS